VQALFTRFHYVSPFFLEYSSPSTPMAVPLLLEWKKGLAGG